VLGRDRGGDERWMSQQQVDTTDRRGEVGGKIKRRNRCEKPTKPPSRPLRIFGSLA
jgi:hypothetical protein